MSASSAWSLLTAVKSPGATFSPPAISSITTGANSFAVTLSKLSHVPPIGRLPHATTPPSSCAVNGRETQETEPGVYRWREIKEGQLAQIELDALQPKPITLHRLLLHRTS